eukprot:TRINITY_DN57763_c0_g1_i1.p1 TRINITY_DN57763_c0_g1~~TRINITY_DN57763_c0_g1_i1.p1  ORF type:complete len:271 (+),score=12.82 TRINITY_DN57763_c0_g1_i1:77-889(+)
MPLFAMLLLPFGSRTFAKLGGVVCVCVFSLSYAARRGEHELKRAGDEHVIAKAHEPPPSPSPSPFFMVRILSGKIYDTNTGADVADSSSGNAAATGSPHVNTTATVTAANWWTMTSVRSLFNLNSKPDGAKHNSFVKVEVGVGDFNKDSLSDGLSKSTLKVANNGNPEFYKVPILVFDCKKDFNAFRFTFYFDENDPSEPSWLFSIPGDVCGMARFTNARPVQFSHKGEIVYQVCGGSTDYDRNTDCKKKFDETPIGEWVQGGIDLKQQF